ncbi:MAG: putative toxin-antitoxin system toxin component, PIN family [Jaaginema sp. PMC 1079.18]|nr:putative toxin-antitoxin system toxin component, PIN family [Jaaginema sp. PMC 1080.18]MEC4852890.1 putative toxin-antitoxin system toxin component, PIN family [Jaaginema sp. PMC 1079.18]MEC4868900.1 putative toxin-antitoxin system toxin component, PIN family [Jaaginema sp. PMC 1078.18]
MTSKPPIKVIIDTNLWIGFLIGQALADLKTLMVSETIQIVLCGQLEEEIRRVTQKPKLRKYFSPQDVSELLDILKVIGLFVEIKSEILVCRDKKDNFLLALAKDSQAEFLMTGDADLLILQEFEGTKIVTYQDFLSQINL